MEDPDDDIVREALGASVEETAVPSDFADGVLAKLGAQRRVARWRGPAVALAAAAVVVAAVAWPRREQRGEVSVPDRGGARTVLLGGRARAVVEPGSRISYRVGGVLTSRADEVQIERGAVFFRVDGGGAFEVRTPHGVVSVTGTCFRVAAEGANEMNVGARARWFGAGAAATVLAVSVYEGGVRVASAGGGSVLLAPGERAAVGRDGALTRQGVLPAELAPARGAGGPGEATSVGPLAERDAREVQRLRGLLAQNGISPETGRREPGTGEGAAPSAGPSAAPTRVRGVDSDGDTDLTQGEWRALAMRGELRFALPGVGSGDAVDRTSRGFAALGIPESEVDGINATARRNRDRMLDQLRGYYREATGSEAGAMSFDGMVSEITDKTPTELVSAVNGQLAQERAGMLPAQAIRAEMSPYEKAARLLVGYEAQLESELAAVVGPEHAHALLHAERVMGRRAYGRSARRPEGAE